MGEPSTRQKDKLYGAAREIMSAMSALLMPPERISTAGPDDVFLADCDVYAKHSREHMKAALRYVQDLQHEQEMEKWSHFEQEANKYENFLEVWKKAPEEVRQTIKEYGLNQHVLNSFPDHTIADLKIVMEKLEDGSWSKPE
jgi:hypothetical protein